MKFIDLLFFISPVTLISCEGTMEDSALVENSLVYDNVEKDSYIYPNKIEIQTDSKVVVKMFDAWHEMLDIQTMHYRIEVGFYIYYDFFNKQFYFSELFYGPKIYYKDDYKEDNKATMKYGDIVKESELCAFFHCHTPYYGMSYTRETGYSAADEEMANILGIPGLLFDYGPKFVTGIYNYVDMEPQIYDFGPFRRTRKFI